MSTTARWHILGAGAMGTCLAHRLARAGVPATLLHHRDRGVRELVIASACERIPFVALADQPPGSIARLLVTTKAGQIGDALRRAAPALDDAAVLVTTANGLGFPTHVPGRALPLHRAVTTAAAFRDEGGRVIAAATGRTQVGDDAGTQVPPAWFADSLAKLPGWTWTATIERAVHDKFAINCVINPLTAVHRCRNGELLQDGQPRPELIALCAETEAILRELHLWCHAGTLLDAVVDVCASTAANRSSMLQDVLAGRSTEIDFLTGHLLHLAAARGLRMPRGEALYRTLAAGSDARR